MMIMITDAGGLRHWHAREGRRRSASDKDSEGHAAARDYHRITMPALLPIILSRKGGLRHVSRPKWVVRTAGLRAW
jgi:hypothetical protein